MQNVCLMWSQTLWACPGLNPIFFLFLKNNFICLFIYDCAVSLFLHRLFSSCGEQELLSSCGAWASHCSGFSCCGARALGAWASVVVVPGLQSLGSVIVGLVASRCVGSSRIRSRTYVSCIGRWILYHRATRKALNPIF